MLTKISTGFYFHSPLLNWHVKWSFGLGPNVLISEDEIGEGLNWELFLHAGGRGAAINRFRQMRFWRSVFKHRLFISFQIFQFIWRFILCVAFNLWLEDQLMEQILICSGDTEISNLPLQGVQFYIPRDNGIIRPNEWCINLEDSFKLSVNESNYS